jgi:hypothetical protein
MTKLSDTLIRFVLFYGGFSSQWLQAKAKGDLFFTSMSNLEKEEEWKISRSQLKFMWYYYCIIFFLLSKVVLVKFSSKLECSTSRKGNKLVIKSGIFI